MSEADQILATIILAYPTAQAIIQASWNWPIARKNMAIYGLSGIVHAEDRHRLRVRERAKADEKMLLLNERESSLNDPSSVFAGVISGKLTLPEQDLSFLESNMVVMRIMMVLRILDAAIRSTREGKTIRFG